MKKYPKYKDSGIPWIGEIPKEWEVRKLKHISEKVWKGNGITKEDVVADGNIDCVRYGEIYSKFNHSFSSCISKTNVSIIKSPQYFQYGDLLFAGTGEKIEEIGKSIVYLGEKKCLAGGDIIVVRPKHNPIFVQYAMNTMEAQNQKSFGKAKLKVVHISAAEICGVYLAIPTPAEQRAIASFLEKKNEQINNCICLRERELQTLNELKQAQIANVVTKGLDPNVPMKDSGIPWIGQIPAHWEVKTLSQVSREQCISNKGMLNNNLLSLSYGRIVQKNINTTDGLLPASFETYQIVHNGNIVLRLTDLQNDHKSLRVGLSTQTGIITSAYVSLAPLNHINPSYLYYSLHSVDIKKVFYSMGGGLRQNLNWSELRKLNIQLPPIEEQKAIVSYIENCTQTIDNYIASLQAEIEHLKEYKQRLISDVVTGKIDVRDEA